MNDDKKTSVSFSIPIYYFSVLTGSIFFREVNRCLRILIEVDRPTLPLSMWPKVLERFNDLFQKCADGNECQCDLLLSTGVGILVKKLLLECIESELASRLSNVFLEAEQKTEQFVDAFSFLENSGSPSYESFRQKPKTYYQMERPRLFLDHSSC
jgi:hypothetical protein